MLTLTVIINQSVPCHITFGKDAKLETKVIFVILIFTTHLKSDCLWKLQTKLLILDSEFTFLLAPKWLDLQLEQPPSAHEDFLQLD